MLDPKRLLTDFLGPDAGGMLDQATRQGKAALGGVDRNKAGTFAAGAAAGGLIGLLLGSKKTKKIGGNLLTYGGAAVLGGLAYKAWQNWQQSKQPVSAQPSGGVAAAPRDSAFDPAAGIAADGKPFALALVRAMIAAAKADGHIDAEEQRDLFQRIETLGLDAEAKAFVFDELSRPTDLAAIAALPRGQEQAAELWLASRLAIDPDDAREKAYLSALGAKLALPASLLAHLETEAAGALPAPVAADRASA
ncbi:MAG TPA: tellurite resistance TerB family protein [Alphaproteobacteria bacterium]|nr:tellurite resistance TerB family protein [Alphaproteobacteria bacterium]